MKFETTASKLRKRFSNKSKFVLRFDMLRLGLVAGIYECQRFSLGAFPKQLLATWGPSCKPN